MENFSNDSLPPSWHPPPPRLPESSFFCPRPHASFGLGCVGVEAPPHRFEYIDAHGAPHSPLGLHTLVLTYSPSTIGYSYLHLR
jgi:hypothetical protein